MLMHLGAVGIISSGEPIIRPKFVWRQANLAGMTGLDG